MRNHWPMVLAVLLLVAAVILGLWQRDALEEHANDKPRVRELPSKYVPFADAPAPPRTLTSAPAQPPLTVTNLAPVPANPVAPQPNVPATTALVPAKPPEAMPKVAMPAQPAGPIPQMGPIAPGSARGLVFTNLRGALVQQFGTAPQPTQNGGFAITTAGVRVEADPNEDWSITLYNNNPANPVVQTDNFKVALNLVVANVGLDMTAQPQVTPEGKQTLKTNSKLNRVSMTTDPAMGNSVTIKPLQKRTTGLVTPQVTPVAPAPANPAAPQVAPPAAPAPAMPNPTPAERPRRPLVTPPGAPQPPAKPVPPAPVQPAPAKKQPLDQF